MERVMKCIANGCSVSEIKSALKDVLEAEHDLGILEMLQHHLEKDDRKGVSDLGRQLNKRIKSMHLEKERMVQMFAFENEARSKGFLRVAGVDEVGRGPLVGPVVTAAVILDPNVDWSGIDDSKRLSAAKREAFYDKIVAHAIAYQVGVVSSQEIDAINILNATKKAMKNAILSINADYLLIDALTLSDIPIKQKAIVKGDTLSASIAAASIVAKVTRDRMMLELAKQYPMYDFENNKGYGTQTHYQAIDAYGLIPEHRRSFLKNYK